MKFIKISQQQVAERVLDILVNELKLKPGDVVPDQQLKQNYRERNGDAANIKDGLKYAGDQEWLSYEPTTHSWHLTDLGHQSA
jgi:hypothetical protein